MGTDKDNYIEYLEQQLRLKEHIINNLNLYIEEIEDCEDIEDIIDSEDSSDYDLELLQSKLLNKEEQIERNGYIIDALVEKIKMLECRIWDLEN